MREIRYIREPTPLQCGQAVLAMLTGLTAEQVTAQCGTDRETTLADMRRVLLHNGLALSAERMAVTDKTQLPQVCLLSLETPRCWHWSLYANGVFYDPEHGILNDFPESRRRYYWAVFPAE